MSNDPNLQDRSSDVPALELISLSDNLANDVNLCNFLATMEEQANYNALNRHYVRSLGIVTLFKRALRYAVRTPLECVDRIRAIYDKLELHKERASRLRAETESIRRDSKTKAEIYLEQSEADVNLKLSQATLNDAKAESIRLDALTKLIEKLTALNIDWHSERDEHGRLIVVFTKSRPNHIEQ